MQFWVAAFSLLMFAALLFKLIPSSRSCDLHLSASGSWVNLLMVLLYAELSQSTSLRITLLSMWWCEGRKIKWTEEKKFFFDLFSCPCMTCSRDPCMQSQMKNPLRRSIFLPKSLLLCCTRKAENIGTSKKHKSSIRYLCKQRCRSLLNLSLSLPPSYCTTRGLSFRTWGGISEFSREFRLRAARDARSEDTFLFVVIVVAAVADGSLVW
jgi:hypothetical protein